MILQRIGLRRAVPRALIVLVAVICLSRPAVPRARAQEPAIAAIIDGTLPGPPDSFSNETATYTSPNYGYTITYDTEQWRMTENATDSTQYGPEDTFSLDALPGNDAQASFSGGYLSAEVPATTYIDRFFEQIKKSSDVENARVRVDAAGNPIQGGDAMHAFISIDLTFSDRLGAKQEINFFVECWDMAETGAQLVLIYISEQRSYDVWAESREELVRGVVIPG